MSKINYNCGGCGMESYYYPEYANPIWAKSNKLCGMCYYQFHKDEGINKKAFYLRMEDEPHNVFWLEQVHREYLS